MLKCKTKMKPFPPPKSPRQYLVRLLSRREYSEHELLQKLKTRDVPEEQARDAIEFVKLHGFQSDERYAASRARTLGARKGNRAIRRELVSKGVDESAIEDALPELGDELERALAAASRFEGKLTDERERARLWRFLVSRGFSGDVTLKVMKKLSRTAHED
jgi:regulatory protein